MAWTAPRTWTQGEVITAALFNTHIRDDFLVSGPGVVTAARQFPYATAATALGVTGAGGALAMLRMNAAATGVEWLEQSDYLPWIVMINAIGPYAAVTGSWTRSLNTNTLFYARIINTAQNDAIEWPVVLAAGTWTIALLGATHPAAGISTVKLDGTDVGTLDWYESPGSTVTGKSITGITVASTGKKVLKIVMATKNASATDYLLLLSLVTCVRTA